MEVRMGPCRCGEPEKVIEEHGRQILVRCPLYINLPVIDDKTKQKRDHWQCSISWTPILLIENMDRMRYVEGEIQALRTESVQRGREELSGLLAVAKNIEKFHNEMQRAQQVVLEMNDGAKQIHHRRDA